MSLNQPVYEFGPNSFVNSLLSVHVIWVDTPFLFTFKHVTLYCPTELTHMIHIVHRLSITFRQSSQHLFLPPQMKQL